MPNRSVKIRSTLRNAGIIALAVLATAALVPGRAAGQTSPGSALGPAPTTPVAPPVAPQGGNPGGPPPILGPNDPRNPLHLTVAQQERRNRIEQRYSPLIQAIIANPKLTQAQKKAQLQALFKKANTELLALLTPSQRAANTRMEKEQSARVAQMQQEFASRRAEVMKMAEAFKKTLTPAQKAKLDALSATAKAQFAQLQNDKSMTMQQKEAKYQALGQSYLAQAKKIYTPAQWAMIQKIRQLEAQPLAPGSP